MVSIQSSGRTVRASVSQMPKVIPLMSNTKGTNTPETLSANAFVYFVNGREQGKKKKFIEK